MKIIDEKGRLFGKINVIDFSVILFLICLMPFFYFGYKIFIKRPEPAKLSELVPKKIIEREIKVDFIKLAPEDLKVISLGDKERDKNGQAIGEIINLGEPKAQIYEIDIGGNKKLVTKDSILQYMSATLKIKAELRQNMLYYKDKQILLDSSIDFKTDKYQVEAVCASLGEVSPPLSKEKVGTKFPLSLKDVITLKNVIKRINALEKEIDDIANIIKRINTLEKKVDIISSFSNRKIKKLIENIE